MDIGYTHTGVSKVLLSIDDALLRLLDQAAASRGLSRSRLVGQLVEREFGLLRGPGQDSAVHHALDNLAELFEGARFNDDRDSTVVIRQMRDSR